MDPKSLQKSKITKNGGNFKNLTWWTFKTQIKYISKTKSYNLIVMSDVDSLKSDVGASLTCFTGSQGTTDEYHKHFFSERCYLPHKM